MLLHKASIIKDVLDKCIDLDLRKIYLMGGMGEHANLQWAFGPCLGVDDPKGLGPEHSGVELNKSH